MKVNLNTLTINCNNKAVHTRNQSVKYCSEKNNMSFKGLNLNDLSGIEKYIISYFDIPITKMNSYFDFALWCQKAVKNIQNSDILSDSLKVNRERWRTLRNWDKFLNEEFRPPENLIISDAIRKNLIINKKAIPPYLDPLVVHTSIVDSYLDRDLKNFDFIYKKNLIENMLFEYKSIDETKPIWAIFQTKQKAPKEFSKNIDKLNLIFSLNGDYNSALNADNILKKNDVHVYFENNMPKLALIYDNNTLENIRPLEKFDINTPNPRFCPIIQEHIENNYLSPNANNILDNIKTEIDVRNYLAKIAKKELCECTPEEIFKLVGFKVSHDIDGKLVLNKYEQPAFAFPNLKNECIPFAHLGIDEDWLVENVSIIEGTADFSKSSANSTGSIRYIVGNLNAGKSNLHKLPNLERVGGWINLENTDIQELPKLRNIDGDVFLTGSKLFPIHFNNANMNGFIYKYNAIAENESLGTKEKLLGIFNKMFYGIIDRFR